MIIFGKRKKRKLLYEKQMQLIAQIKRLGTKDFTIDISAETGYVTLFPPEGTSNTNGIRKDHVTLCSDGSKKYTLKLPRTSYLGFPVSEYKYDPHSTGKCEITEEQYNAFMDAVKGCDRVETKASVMHMILINKEIINQYNEIEKMATRVSALGLDTHYQSERYSIPNIIEVKPYVSSDCAEVIETVKTHMINIVTNAFIA